MSLMFAIILLCVVLGVGGWGITIYRMSQPFDNPVALFRALCRAHDLTSPQRKLLLRMAQTLQLPSPSALFIDSGLWTIPESTGDGGDISRQDWEKIQALRCVVFLPATARVSQIG